MTAAYSLHECNYYPQGWSNQLTLSLSVRPPIRPCVCNKKQITPSFFFLLFHPSSAHAKQFWACYTPSSTKKFHEKKRGAKYHPRAVGLWLRLLNLLNESNDNLLLQQQLITWKDKFDCRKGLIAHQSTTKLPAETRTRGKNNNNLSSFASRESNKTFLLPFYTARARSGWQLD